MDPVRSAAAALRGALASLEPGTFDASSAASLAEELALTENACGVAKLRMARRAGECGAHRERGFADVSDWVATSTGSTVSEARKSLDAVAAVDECPETREALVSGSVSVSQAAEIVATERVVPGSEAELLTLAKIASLGAVRSQARKRRVESIDPEDLHRRQHRAREFRHHRDELGMVCGTFRLTPVIGTSFVNRLDRETDRRWRAAKRAGRSESRDALAADVFAEMVAEQKRAASEEDAKGSRRRGVSADVVIVQAAEVARRGHAHSGELCHVVGVGPVAASVVDELIGAGAFVKAVLHDGEQVTHVAHYGRNLSAAQRTARGIGPPPEFDGRRCSEPGCERRLGLETDHIDPIANGGATSSENLGDLCTPHHWAKTRRDRAAGRLGARPGERGPPAG